MARLPGGLRRGSFDAGGHVVGDKAAKLRRTDPIQQDPRPSYVYRWCTAHNRHISAMGKDGYERLGQLAAAPVTTLVPRWDRDWVKLHEAAA